MSKRIFLALAFVIVIVEIAALGVTSNFSSLWMASVALLSFLVAFGAWWLAATASGESVSDWLSD